jgi:hypothetical protein
MGKFQGWVDGTRVVGLGEVGTELPGRRQKHFRSVAMTAVRGPGHPPAALTQRTARRPRPVGRRGPPALPPPRRPRIVLEPSSNRPRTVPEGSARIPEGSDHRPRRPRSPSARLGALARLAGVVRRPFRRHDALESSSNRPRIVLESSSNRPRTVLEPSPRVPASFPEGSGHRPHRSRSPSARLGALARLAGVVRRPFLRHDALESSSNRPRTGPEGSGQLPARIWPAPPTRSRSPTPRGGRPSGRRPAFQNQPPPTTRFAA